jgi:hypothetical protein
MTAPRRRWSFTTRDILWAMLSLGALLAWATERYEHDHFPYGMRGDIESMNGPPGRSNWRTRHGQDLRGHAHIEWTVRYFDPDKQSEDSPATQDKPAE